MKSICFICLFSFSVFSQNADINLLKSINHSYSPNGGKFFTFISESVTPVSIGAPVIVFTTGIFQKDSATRWKGIELLSAQVINGIFTTGLKFAIDRDRPFITYPDDFTKYGKAGSHSFPSGHTSTAFAFATSMTLSYPHWYIAVPCYVYAAAVGYSRMYLGVHYPTDVLGGMLLGTATAFGTHYLIKWVQKKF